MRIPFLVAGTHRSHSGHAVKFSERDVAAIATTYDPAVHEAPIVIGHPTTDAPAYGWIERIEHDDSALAARPHQVNTEFSEMVQRGAFKKISARFYTPGHPAHPLGDDAQSYYLRHVGFLGAQPPAIKGLPAVEFAEEDGDTVTVELAFSEAAYAEMPWWMPDSIRRVFQNLREWIVETQGIDAADRVIPTTALDEMEQADAEAQMEARDGDPSASAAFAEGTLARTLESAIEDQTSDDRSRADIVQDMADAAGIETGTVNQILRGDIEEVPDERLSGFAEVLDIPMDTLQEARVEFADPAFSDPDDSDSDPTDDPMSDEAQQKQKDLERREQKLKEREAALARKEAEQKREAAVAFAEEHLGKVTPAHKDTLVETLLLVDADEDATVEFAEGDEKSVGEALRAFVKALPDQISFSEETARPSDPDALDPDAPEYARTLAQKAAAFMEQAKADGRTLTIDQAIEEVKAQR